MKSTNPIKVKKFTNSKLKTVQGSYYFPQNTTDGPSFFEKKYATNTIMNIHQPRKSFLRAKLPAKQSKESRERQERTIYVTHQNQTQQNIQQTIQSQRQLNQSLNKGFKKQIKKLGALTKSTIERKSKLNVKGGMSYQLNSTKESIHLQHQSQQSQQYTMRSTVQFKSQGTQIYKTKPKVKPRTKSLQFHNLHNNPYKNYRFPVLEESKAENLPLNVPNKFTLEKGIAHQIIQNDPSYMKKMTRLQKEFKMIQKAGKEGKALQKTFSSVVLLHRCSLKLPRWARDYVKYNQHDQKRLNQKNFRKRFNKQAVLRNLKNVIRDEKQEENDILTNYKRWDERKSKIEQENRELKIKTLSKPPPKKNFIKIERMLSTQRALTQTNTKNAFKSQNYDTRTFLSNDNFFQRDDQQRILDMLNKTYTSQKLNIFKKKFKLVKDSNEQKIAKIMQEYNQLCSLSDLMTQNALKRHYTIEDAQSKRENERIGGATCNLTTPFYLLTISKEKGIFLNVLMKKYRFLHFISREVRERIFSTFTINSKNLASKLDWDTFLLFKRILINQDAEIDDKYEFLSIVSNFPLLSSFNNLISTSRQQNRCPSSKWRTSSKKYRN